MRRNGLADRFAEQRVELLGGVDAAELDQPLAGALDVEGLGGVELGGFGGCPQTGEFVEIGVALGGADGLHPDLKKNADWLWSLSKLTLPHGMVRVVLSEQLYRAWSVINNHPYHRE